MADFSVPITVPDDKLQDFLESQRWHYDNAAATPQELRDAVAADVRQLLVKRYKAWKAYQLQINPPSDEIDIR